MVDSLENNDIQEIWSEAQLEIEVNHQVGKNHQFLVEETIGNLAALKALSSSDEVLIEMLGKNS